MQRGSSEDKVTKFKKRGISKPLEKFQAKKTDEDGDFWLRLVKHRMGIIIRVAIVVGVFLVATLLFYLYLQNKDYTVCTGIQKVDYETISGAKSVRYGNNIFSYSSDGAKCIAADGTVIWNETFEMQSPMYDMCQDIVAIADYNGSKIYIMNKEGKLGTIDTGMPIRDFKVSASGVVVAVLEDVKSTPIYVYNAVGEKKAYFSTSMKNSGYPLEVSISENGYLVGISYLYVDSGEIKTNVAFYNFGEVGKNETDNLVSGYTYSGAIVPILRFLGNDKAIAVADNRCMFYSGDQKPTSTSEVMLQEEIKAVFNGDTYCALAFTDSTGEHKYRIDIYDGNGKLRDSIFTDIEYRDMFFQDNRIVIYSDTEWIIHNIGGKDRYQGEFEGAILALMPTSSPQRYVQIFNDSITTIELR